MPGYDDETTSHGQERTGSRQTRFHLPPGDDQEFIPLPEIPLTVSYP